MPERGDGAVVRRWCAIGLDALRRHRSEIDALNVYPVPDGDTGTNLALTMAAAVAAVDAAPAVLGAGELLALAARGALLGARGNSGIILAQLLKGLSSALATARVVGGAELTAALDSAARSAYAAVAAPVEGTVLSVATAAARAAASSGGAHQGPAGVAQVARAAAAGARVALARTPQQLPALARAGVVDAGGRGLVVLLEAFVTALTGEQPPAFEEAPTAATAVPGGVMEREAGSVEFGYEVQFLLDAPAAAIGPLRQTLGELGDSLVVVGDDPTWHVHVHVNDVGAAIEAGIAAGRPSRISVTRFAEQIAQARSGHAFDPSAASSADPAQDSPESASSHPTDHTSGGTSDRSPDRSWDRSGDRMSGPSSQGASDRSSGGGSGRAGDGDWDRTWESASELPGGPAAAAPGSGVVVVCSGQGMKELLAAEGATVLTGTPSTGEVLAAIRATGASRVVILPNDANVVAVANAAAAEARAAGVRAGVVPTRSPVQALAAMAVRDTSRRFEDDVIAMAEAAARCRSAELTVAAREALTVAGRCQPGDVLAIVDGEVNLIGQDLERTACMLLDRMLLAGGELVTLIAGQGAPAGLGETLSRHVAGAWPFVEVQCYEGGQPHYPLLVGVE